MAKEAGAIDTIIVISFKKYIYIIGLKALSDAGITYTQIEQAVVGYVYGK